MKRVIKTILIICLLLWLLCWVNVCREEVKDVTRSDVPWAWKNKDEKNEDAQPVISDSEKEEIRMQAEIQRVQKEIREQQREQRQIQEKSRQQTKQRINSAQFKKLHQTVQDGLKNGIFYSITPKLNEARMDPLVWSLLPIESKWATIELFSQYFSLHSDAVGNPGDSAPVTIRSKYSDEKLGGTGWLGGYKIYREK